MLQQASPLSGDNAGFTPMLPWFNVTASSLMALQQVQLEAVKAWQQALADMQQELWDEWISHWGGGAPIDR